MSELSPALIALDKGLNLQTAKVVAPPGSVLDSLNYEQVDFQGQKRIDGFARYDGSLLPALNEYYVITASTDVSLVEVGALVFTEDDELIGVVVGKAAPIVYIVIINENLIPAAADVLNVIAYPEGVPAATFFTVATVETGREAAADADEHYTNLLAFIQALKARVEELPGSIAGLHWFRDRLYAVAGVTTVSLDGTTPAIFPNDTLVYDGRTASVLDVRERDNTRIILIDDLDYDHWQTEGGEVFRSAVSVGLIANGYEEFDAETDFASFFESRSEAQVLEEDAPGPYDFGWRFKHLGWIVNFEDGVSLFGSLPSLNQNIEGLGIQGPTSITGESGRPLELKQNVDIDGMQAQVNGWKSSNTPTTYELDPDNLTSVDSLYIYADAFLQWDGDANTVSAPGITTSTLTEYPANSTVEVEI